MMSKKKVEEVPFKALFSKEQQNYIKNIKCDLQDYLGEPIDEDNYEQSAKQHLLIEGLFKLPVSQQNLYLVKLYGNYSSVSQLANDLKVTKQTLCKVQRETKKYLEEYVNNNFKPYAD